MFPEIPLDRSDDRLLHDQLADGVRKLVLTGRLSPGTRLPSTRRAADELGVSRSVVVRAYERLQFEGYLDAGVGIGTWVRESLPEHLLRPEVPDRGERAASMDGRDATLRVGQLSRRGRTLAEAGDHPLLHSGLHRPFRPSAVDPELFPVREWARISGKVWRASGREFLPYGDARGYADLREQIAVHLTRHRGVECDASRIIVTTGSQQGLDLCVRLLFDPGDSTMVEDPGYPGIHAALRAGGVGIEPVAVNAGGVSEREVGSASDSVRALYLTPSHQFPLGVTLSLERRLRLLDWAHEHDAWILEDDYDSEFRYEARPLPSLQGLDRHGRVLYAGTFSKVLAPGLRLGFLVVPESLVDPFRSASRAVTHHPPIGLQATLAEFMAAGHFQRHLGRARTVYGYRREVLVEALQARLGDRVQVLPEPAGLHLTALLPEHVDDVEVSRAALRRSIVAPALSLHYLRSESRSGLILGFGVGDDDSMRDGVEVLAEILGEKGA